MRVKCRSGRERQVPGRLSRPRVGRIVVQIVQAPVYGASPRGAVPGDERIRPGSLGLAYAASKARGRLALPVRINRCTEGVDLRSALFTVYGPYQRPEMARDCQGCAAWHQSQEPARRFTAQRADGARLTTWRGRCSSTRVIACDRPQLRRPVQLAAGFYISAGRR